MNFCPGKEKPASGRVGRAPCAPPSLSDVDSDELSRGNFEVGFRPQKSVRAQRERPPEAEDRQQGGGPEPAGGASDAEAVAQLPKPEGAGPAVSPGPAEFQSGSPGWGSAFYEAECFGADVCSYVAEMARQKAGGAPDAQSPVSEGPLCAAGGGHCAAKPTFRLELPSQAMWAQCARSPCCVPEGRPRSPVPCVCFCGGIVLAGLCPPRLGQEMAFLSISWAPGCQAPDARSPRPGNHSRPQPCLWPGRPPPSQPSRPLSLRQHHFEMRKKCQKLLAHRNLSRPGPGVSLALPGLLWGPVQSACCPGSEAAQADPWSEGQRRP